MEEFLSAIALATTIVGLVPQVYHTYYAKSARDLSMIMLANFALSSLAWIGYGAIIGDKTVVLANIFCLTTVLISCGQKIYYDHFYQHDSIAQKNSL